MRHALLSLSVCWVACQFGVTSFAQSRDRDDDYASLSPAQACKALADFRDSRLNGDLCLRIEITHKPRKGDSSPAVRGIIWAAFTAEGQQMRGEIQDANGQAALAFTSTKGAASNAVWISRQGQSATLSRSSGWQPLADGLLLSAFDLHLPFTHWRDTRYINTAKSRGRPVHFFDAINDANDAPAKVNFALDRTYGALVKAVCFNARGEAIRTLQVDEFSKVDEQWILGGCSVLDETTRDADVLRVTEAAVGLKLDASLFRPETLSKPATPPTTLKKL